MTSIRRRLLVWLIAALSVATAIALGATFIKARDDVNELFDYQLQQLAFSLRNQPFTVASRGFDSIGEDDDDR